MNIIKKYLSILMFVEEIGLVFVILPMTLKELILLQNQRLVWAGEMHLKKRYILSFLLNHELDLFIHTEEVFMNGLIISMGEGHIDSFERHVLNWRRTVGPRLT